MSGIADEAVTPRDRLMIRILGSGATNREIAARLGVKEQTVKNRLSRLYGIIGVRNRVELALSVAKMTAQSGER